MLILRRWFIVISLLLNSGCNLLGPTYIKPLTKVPANWSHQNNIKLDERVNLPDLRWWQQFHTAELDDLIQIALHRNNDLNIAMANLDAARAQLLQVKLNWLPGLNFLSGYTQMPYFGNPGRFYIFFPQYVINLFQQYKKQKSAEAMVKASCYAKDAARLTLITQVASGFFTLIAQQEAMKIYKRLLHRMSHYLLLSQSQYRHGLISHDQLDELDSEIKQIQSRLQITQHNIVVSKNALHFLLNHNPGVMNIKTSFQRINTTHVIPSNLPVTVLKHRPDVREAESILKAANADVGVATTSLLPSISLGAYLGQGSSITGPISLSEGYLNTPLLDFPVIGQIRVSRARYHALCRKYINTVRQALRDVENDLSAYTTYTNQFNNNKRAFTHEKQRCHWVDIRYQRGIDNDRNRIQCHIKLDQFELMLNQNKLEKMLTIVSLYQDLAGGYHGV